MQSAFVVVVNLFVLCAAASALLQVHTRLAGAILKQAVNGALRERETYLAEADRLLAKADEIDAHLERLGYQPRGAPPARPQRAPDAPDTLDALDALAARSRLARVSDLDDAAATLAPLPPEDLRGVERLYVLAWPSASASDGITVGRDDETFSVLALPAAPPRTTAVLVALESETQARQIAHVMSDLEGFALQALGLPLDDLADLVVASDATLGVIRAAAGALGGGGAGGSSGSESGGGGRGGGPSSVTPGRAPAPGDGGRADP